ncbi:hypothetical protein BYZ73_19890 [Rhodovulum viride]|uniref:HK97 gp10 family phage protein n=2 Tax=Rhodovulum viride TaxID=1231134 RepID=A0ABX9DBT4_9RHOB|nr:hypothetical protein BYZ73_19890 [Rhodovulum viride]
MSISMKVTGLKEIEKALADLPRSTSKGVARRVMKKELQPVADMANALWPGADDDVFQVTHKVSRSQPQPPSGRSVVNMVVGAPSGRDGKPHAHLLEWGTGPRYHESGKYTGSVSPQPMLTPAWDATKDKVLRGLAERFREEIAKTVARRAKRAARR